MSRKKAIEALREICQTKKNEPFITPYIRKGSIYVTYALIKTPISANQITSLTILFALFAGWLLTFGNYWHSVLAGLFLQLIILLDHVDGEVARYRRFLHPESEDHSGKFLESIQHTIEMPAIFIGIAYGIFERTNQLDIFTLGFSALYFFLAFRIISQYVGALSRSDNVRFVTEPSIWAKIPSFDKENKQASNAQRLYRSKHLRMIFFTAFRSEFLDILVLFAAVIDQLWIALFLHGVIFPPFVLVYTYVSFKQMQRF